MLRFTNGDQKLEKLLTMCRPSEDKSGLGFDKYNNNGNSHATVFVKGESSNSEDQPTASKIVCHYCGEQGHMKFECKYPN